MALVVKDRVRETTTTTGTGTITLGGAATGFQSFSVIGDSNTTFYTIQLSNTNEWEVGVGTYTLSGTTYPAEKAIYLGNLPTKMVVTKRDTTTADVALANGFLPVLNRSGSTINVTVS